MFGFFPHSATGMGAILWKARDPNTVFIEVPGNNARKARKAGNENDGGDVLG
jgi:hypothetical protein